MSSPLFPTYEDYLQALREGRIYVIPPEIAQHYKMFGRVPLVSAVSAKAGRTKGRVQQATAVSDPDSLNGLHYWIDATDSRAFGGSLTPVPGRGGADITGLTARSGEISSAINLQSPGTRTNPAWTEGGLKARHPGITFDGSGDLLSDSNGTETSIAAGDFEWYSVVKMSSGVSQFGTFIRWMGMNWQMETNVATLKVTGSFGTHTFPNRINSLSDDAQILGVIRRNNKVFFTSSGTRNTTQPGILGRTNTGGSDVVESSDKLILGDSTDSNLAVDPMPFKFAEMVCYKGQLTNTERRGLFDYFKSHHTISSVTTPSIR